MAGLASASIASSPDTRNDSWNRDPRICVLTTKVCQAMAASQDAEMKLMNFNFQVSQKMLFLQSVKMQLEFELRECLVSLTKDSSVGLH